MKALFIIFCFSATFLSNAQTALIAHKSHSGSEGTFFIDPNSNFGEMAFPDDYRIEYYTILNDSVILRIVSNGYTALTVDTLRNDQRESLEAFQIEDQRKLRIEDSIRLITDTITVEGMNLIRYRLEQKNSAPIISNPGAKNPPSFLLVLFCVSAVLMLLVRLVVRERKPSML